MMPPLVSVCIPAYRQPVAVSRAMASTLSQSFRDFEIVVTDDSPDDSVERALSQPATTMKRPTNISNSVQSISW